MKKFFTLLAAALLLSAFSTTASAKGGVIVKGGLNYPSFDFKDFSQLEPASATGWHAGIGWQSGTFAGFALQPELLFQRSGINWTDEDLQSEEAIKLNALQLMVNVQWGIDLILFRPYIFAAPYVSWNLSKSYEGSAADDFDAFVEGIKNVDYGFGLGIGVDIWKLQVSAKYNWSFAKVVDWESYKQQYSGLTSNTAAFHLSVAFKF